MIKRNLLYGLCIGAAIISTLNINYEALGAKENRIWFVNVALTILLLIALFIADKKNNKEE